MSLETAVTAVQGIRKALIDAAEAIAAIPTSPELPYPEHHRTNAILLADALAKLFADAAQFEYLPAVISSHIVKKVIEVHSALPGTDGDAATNWPPVLQQLDKLYADCLQYGIISFGFDGKVIQQELDSLRKAVREAKRFSSAVKQDVDRAMADARNRIEATQTRIEKAATEAEEKVQSHLEQTEQAVKTSAESQAKLAEIQEHCNQQRQAVEEAVAAIGTAREQTDEAAAAAQEQFDALITDATSSKSQVQQITSQTEQLAAEAKSLLKAITEARADSKTELDAIVEFYADLEKHQQDLVDVRKETQSKFNALKEESQTHVAQLREQTDAIVNRNQELISEIEDHLRKAVGATLFTAFDVRRAGVFRRSMGWAACMAVSVASAVLFAWWFVNSLAQAITDNEVNLYVAFARFILAAPIAFLIVFSAKQYGRERRAEEEYAFKSSVSVSLESYRDLIVRMQQEKAGVDTEFIKELVREIFDNPTKRLYLKDGGAPKRGSTAP